MKCSINSLFGKYIYTKGEMIMQANEVLKLMEAIERTVQYIDQSTKESNNHEIHQLSKVKQEILLAKAEILKNDYKIVT